ncbi:GcvT family protein [Nesterenkonia marinintestina]|uniref:GcvT family protein n=1 Tax=Nesterenkonia marinintestina TaxID=2979865 RepID=UPI0021C0F339|nr:FAD-dependent oxidoreductase [Nesterenkonia sp. GX14115]
MSQSGLPEGSRVVIIGLGVVGAALADELVLRGRTDVTVVEQGPLYATGGSSSHAPGFVFQISPHRAMTELARRTLDKLDGAAVDDGWVMKRVGGIEIATTPERLRELHRRLGLARSWGVPAELLSAEQVGRLWPGLDTDLVLGGLHTPNDAVVKGVRAVEFQARRAEAGGATILPDTRAVAIRRDHGRVTGVDVVPVGVGDVDPQTLDADVVVSCTGLWGPGAAREMLDLDIAMVPVEHGFGFSLPAPAVTDLDEGTEVGRPMLRHQDFAMYLREWGDRICIGAYEHRPLPVAPEEIASPEEARRTGVQPSIHPFTREDYQPTWDETRRLLPALRSVDLDEDASFNGIFSFTPDGGPLLGPVPGTEGLWMAQAVWVTQSAGVGQVMADWIVHGDPGIDTHGLDLSRFDPAVVTRRWAREQGEESYDEVYDIVHPKATTLRMRGLRTSPFHERQQALGAVFESSGGWERPLWYGADTDGSDGAPAPERDPWTARHWDPAVAAEVRGLRASVGLVDMTPLPRLEVSGAGASEFFAALSDEGALSRPVGTSVGSIVYALMLGPRGGILSDVTIARTGDQEFHLGVNGHQDAAWLSRKMRAHGADLRITDVSTGSCGVGLWGPQAREVLSRLVDEDVSREAFGFYRCRRLQIAGVPVLSLRLSYVGELGWEIYAPAEFGRFLWDEIMAAGRDLGIVPVGRRAFESMRLEKGFRLWGSDMTPEHTPAEAGLDFAVRGAAADRLAALGADLPTRRLACLTLDDPTHVLMGHEPVFDPARGSDGPVGYVTSADQGHTVGQSIAYAWVPSELAAEGTPLLTEHFGDRWRAHVVADRLFDPSGSRMRS